MNHQNSSTNPPTGGNFFDAILQQRTLLFAGILLVALMGFEMFNFSTTQFALTDLLGDMQFAGVPWATILALAFCGIDFAGIARILSPDEAGAASHEVWYLFAAWLLAATLNAILTWWGVSMAMVNHTLMSTSIVDPAILEKVVPIFVALVVWVTRFLLISTFSTSGMKIFAGIQQEERRAKRPARSASAYQADPLPQHNERPQTAQAASARPQSRSQSSERPQTTHARPSTNRQSVNGRPQSNFNNGSTEQRPQSDPRPQSSFQEPSMPPRRPDSNNVQSTNQRSQSSPTPQRNDRPIVQPTNDRLQPRPTSGTSSSRPAGSSNQSGQKSAPANNANNGKYQNSQHPGHSSQRPSNPPARRPDPPVEDDNLPPEPEYIPDPSYLSSRPNYHSLTARGGNQSDGDTKPRQM